MFSSRLYSRFSGIHKSNIILRKRLFSKTKSEPVTPQAEPELPYEPRLDVNHLHNKKWVKYFQKFIMVFMGSFLSYTFYVSYPQLPSNVKKVQESTTATTDSKAE